MNVVAVSDLHGFLPAIPPCDLLLLGGDLCPVRDHHVEFQAAWLDTEFRRWLGEQPARKIVAVAGNHDFVFERRPDLLPANLPWTYLQDQLTEWEGWRIYGTPWQPWFYNWAFNLYEDDLKAKWDLIPDSVDILLLHGPPYGYGDEVSARKGGGVENTGSPSLLRRIEEVKPKLAVFGHIHEGRGEWRHGDTLLANVTLLDVAYEPVHPLWTCTLSR